MNELSYITIDEGWLKETFDNLPKNEQIMSNAFEKCLEDLTSESCTIINITQLTIFDELYYGISYTCNEF